MQPGTESGPIFPGEIPSPRTREVASEVRPMRRNATARVLGLLLACATPTSLGDDAPPLSEPVDAPSEPTAVVSPEERAPDPVPTPSAAPILAVPGLPSGL